jgi:hypothetical protein
MRDIWKSFVQFFVSLKLTVVLLSLSMVLVFWATWEQKDFGIWEVQQRFFHSLFVLAKIPGTEIPVPVFPGGYFIGGLLLINLIAAHVYRFRFTWKKSGIFLTHFGLILLLVGELLSGFWQEEFHLSINEGQTKNYAESPRYNELAIIDASDPAWDDVVVIPEDFLNHADAIQHPKLPFKVVPRAYYPNATLQMRSQLPEAPPSPATVGIGSRVVATPLAYSYKEDVRNMPAAFVELVAPEGSLGTFLVSTELSEPQSFDYHGKTWKLALRFERRYYPFSLTLLKVAHDVYPGSDIPKNFSSQVQLKSDDGHDNRETLIYMNNPLRYRGMAFYQNQMNAAAKNSVLQVMRNPSWVIPYVSCILMGLGLVVQFGLHLVSFANKQARSPTVEKKLA